MNGYINDLDTLGAELRHHQFAIEQVRLHDEIDQEGIKREKELELVCTADQGCRRSLPALPRFQEAVNGHDPIITVNSRWRSKQVPIEVTVTGVGFRTMSFIALTRPSRDVAAVTVPPRLRAGVGAQEEAALTPPNTTMVVFLDPEQRKCWAFCPN